MCARNFKRLTCKRVGVWLSCMLPGCVTLAAVLGIQLILSDSTAFPSKARLVIMQGLCLSKPVTLASEV